MRHLLAVLAMLPLLGCPNSGDLGGDPPVPTSPESVTLETDDGLSLAATYQAAPGADRGPALLLLHQFERDQADFDVLWEELLSAGFSLLSMDFRGHGASDPSPVPINLLLSDREQLGWDVQAGLDFLLDQTFDIAPNRIGAIGLSVGGNMAIVANHETHGAAQGAWGCAAIATVSARRDRAEDLAGDNSLTLRDGLYIAGEDETIQAEQAVLLEEITLGDREAMLVPGTDAHGAVLLAEDAAVRARLVDWFVEIGL